VTATVEKCGIGSSMVDLKGGEAPRFIQAGHSPR